MIADLKPYPAMKDSGVEWLRAVPEHWEVRRLGQIGRLSKGNGGNKEDEVSLGVPCVRYGDLYTTHTHFILKSRSFVSMAKAEDYTPITFGDVLFAASGETIDEIGESAVNLMQSEACCGGDVILFRSERQVEARYMGYATDCRPAAAQKATMGRGITVKHVYGDQLKYLTLALPPLPEQAAIVRYLDHADRRIRRYIHAKQKLVKLLEEQKQVLIHRAVTGRVDVRTGRPYPAYKDSGVEWLGEVPEHWERARLKAFLLRPMRNGLFKKKDAFGSGAPLVNVADIYHDSFQIDPASLDRVQTTPDELRTYQVRTGDLFFVRSSLKLEGTGRSAVAIDCEAGSVFECHLVQGRPDPRRAVARFLAFQLNSFSLRHYMISRANVVTMATVSQGVLASCPVFLPSISEQEGLLKQIDGECARVAATHDRAHREIDLLHEYRTRLIADVVTGKLDVRKAAAGLPDEVEEPDPFDETGALTDGEEEPSDGFDNTPEEAVV